MVFEACTADFTAGVFYGDTAGFQVLPHRVFAATGPSGLVEAVFGQEGFDGAGGAESQALTVASAVSQVGGRQIHPRDLETLDLSSDLGADPCFDLCGTGWGTAGAIADDNSGKLGDFGGFFPRQEILH